MSTVIEVINLKKQFKLAKPQNGNKTFEAVKGISFSVNRGEIFGILGPNGAGKTTTLEIIEGINTQTSGTVKVLGLDNITSADEIKKHIGIQLQSSQYFPYLTLGELLDLFASFYGQKADKQGLLNMVNLVEKQDSQVKTLSGGQQQRFTIATSLVNDPHVLFLDEPTTGLDPHARRKLWQLIKEINHKGITIVLTTHYMEEAEFLCHRVAIMDQGQILEIDEPRKLIDRLSETTQVSFFTDSNVNAEMFAAVPGIEKIYTRYPKITLELKTLDNISAIVAVLKQHRVPFSGFTVKTASLEDVYLDITGHEFEQ